MDLHEDAIYARNVGGLYVRCGVDIVTEDATRPLSKYAILEINSAPGLDNYLFSGLRQQDYVDNLYLKVLLSIMNGEKGSPA